MTASHLHQGGGFSNMWKVDNRRYGYVLQYWQYWEYQITNLAMEFFEITHSR